MAVVVDDLGWAGGGLLAGVRGTKKLHASLYVCTVGIRWSWCSRNGQYRVLSVGYKCGILVGLGWICSVLGRNTDTPVGGYDGSWGTVETARTGGGSTFLGGDT